MEDLEYLDFIVELSTVVINEGEIVLFARCVVSIPLLQSYPRFKKSKINYFNGQFETKDKRAEI